MYTRIKLESDQYHIIVISWNNISVRIVKQSDNSYLFIINATFINFGGGQGFVQNLQKKNMT